MSVGIGAVCDLVFLVKAWAGARWIVAATMSRPPRYACFIQRDSYADCANLREAVFWLGVSCYLHARHRLDISLTITRHERAMAVPAPTARAHGYLEPSPARRGRLAQSQAGNSVSSGCSQYAATWDQSGQLSPPLGNPRPPNIQNGTLTGIFASNA